MEIIPNVKPSKEDKIEKGKKEKKIQSSNSFAISKPQHHGFMDTQLGYWYFRILTSATDSNCCKPSIW